MSPSPLDPRAIAGLLAARLPPDVDAALHALLRAAAPADVFVVGGAVRDVILDRALQDLDVVVAGDALAAAQQAWPERRITAHARFGTASAHFADYRLDLASTRTEAYARPGALPAVRLGVPIEDDLTRRDFACNAVALRLSGEPALIDPGGGLRDIDARVIRILHDRSFLDDPTRVFRAERYATRLGFAIEPKTRRLLHEGAASIATLSGARIRNELDALFLEHRAGDALQASDHDGVLRAVHPVLTWDDRRTRAWEQRQTRDLGLAFGYALLAGAGSPADANAIVERLRLPRASADAVRGVAAAGRLTPTLRRAQAKPSGIAVVLDRLPVPAIVAFAATTSDAIAASLTLRYLDQWRAVRPLLSGRDLQDLGVPEGPRIQQGLTLIRAARLDGWAQDADDERALVLRYAKSIRDAGAATAPLEFDPDAS
ncbi:MAG: CCA tRNA nucleotidyltransferase [Chloroflexi bacterium]|nr:CCA tRNA nucleotidyltransferase [Chloroflexota bacterium]